MVYPLTPRIDKELEKIEKRKMDASNDQNPKEFYLACTAGGFSGEDNPHLFNRGLEMILSATTPSEISISKKRLRKTKFDYESFGEEISESSINPYNNKNILQKAEILKKYGVRNLIVSKGHSVPIENAPEFIIREVFKGRYKTYLKKKNQ